MGILMVNPCQWPQRRKGEVDELAGKLIQASLLQHTKELLFLYSFFIFSFEHCKWEAIIGLHGQLKTRAGSAKKQFIGVFALISGASSRFVLARTLLLTAITNKTAQRLFTSMITSIFQAPMSFLDTTSSSQILDRSSTDQATVDTDISYRVAGLVFALIELISVIAVLSHVA